MSRSVRTDYEAVRENQARMQEAITIYPKHPDADAYRVGAAYEPYAIVATEKRFTDAELAAEYWLLSSRRQRLLAYDDGLGSATHKAALRDRERMDTIQRFATNPSYDE